MLRINNVKENSQSHTSGVEVDDYIYEVNGEEIRNEFHFLAILEKVKSTNERIQAVIFKKNNAKIVYFDADSPIGIQFAKDKEYFKYTLDVDFSDVLIFLIIWIILVVITLGLASPFFVFYLAKFIINHTEKHKKTISK
ncbi:MAG: hypothetical protein ABJV04_15910 [Aliiglaciecola sp.]|uniref:DUF6693 family protein n=1 Tax=Aliiglaciecola sp. TaxID=1872441 RepID=UPI003299BAE3